ncbi:uncharacterized protein LOC126409850 [Nymphaea colorata]|uniref:uncharacterized protein LOC126409850 n=1 Tax=Nymphaea colorata TaxID=210225 RepID=UPI00214EFDFF|nr:uncharacterized protein LOC126409850 [Nymphaea colorata]
MWPIKLNARGKHSSAAPVLRSHVPKERGRVRESTDSTCKRLCPGENLRELLDMEANTTGFGIWWFQHVANSSNSPPSEFAETRMQDKSFWEKVCYSRQGHR